jgi:hypothetical protein
VDAVSSTTGAGVPAHALMSNISISVTTKKFVLRTMWFSFEWNVLNKKAHHQDGTNLAQVSQSIIFTMGII